MTTQSASNLSFTQAPLRALKFGSERRAHVPDGTPLSWERRSPHERGARVWGDRSSGARPRGAPPLSSLALLLIVAAPTCLASCGDDTACPQGFTCTENTGGSGGSGGNTGGSGGNTGGDGGTGGGPPPDCTPTEGQAIGTTCGVFVNASAPAGGDGSQQNPYTSILAALQNLNAAEHIYVCGGDVHSGSVSLPASVALSGGLTCDTWSYAAANPKPTLQGSPDLPALSLLGTGNTALTSVVIAGAAPSGSGGSSIGLLAEERTVTAMRIDVTAAAGTAGTVGADAMQTNSMNGGAGTAGNAAPACGTGTNSGGMETLNDSCASGESKGGAGGASLDTQGASGLAGTTGVSGQGGVGQPNMAAWDCSVGVGGGGNNGSAGSPGSPGSPGSSKGTLMSTGFLGSAGGNGGNGDPGQGGGGGGGSRGLVDCNLGMGGNQPRAGASGGSGGAGGCGGIGAAGGTAGGSSLAVVLINAEATFTESTFTAADGAAGGDGGRGQPGAAGGFGANGGIGDLANVIDNACRGGDGGTGGRGGGGGGGRGGHSAAILFEGTAPTLEESTSMPGAPGAGGLGQGANPGSAGTAGSGCAVMDFTDVAEACL